MTALVPLPVLLPLFAAALLVAVGRHVHPRLHDALSLLVALAVTGLALVLYFHAPLEHWFGGWQPKPGVVLGIGFRADAAGCIMATAVGVIFAASFAFAGGYFDESGPGFQVLMLCFLGAMEGFCLTRDLFNLFVWFELMSVAAFALTAWRLEASAIEGAMTFTVTNSLASFAMLGGIGLLYARAGTLDFDALRDALGQHPDDTVAIAGFVLLAGALLTKAAAAPFHFWLADAHTVAPSPVSVIFSGAMVGLGVFGLARLESTVFAGLPAAGAVAGGLLTALGVLSTLLGGALCLGQRHLKRMLAFSTIAHTGIALCGVALLSGQGLAGALLYLVSHGMAKGALFMLAGILLALRGGVDEIVLRGKGRALWPAGLAMALGGLLLGGLPVGGLDEGLKEIDAAFTAAGRGWMVVPLFLGTAMTGGAVLRATGRIFLGWGELSGEEASAPTEPEQERKRPFWLMLLPVIVLLALALLAMAGKQPARQAAEGMLGSLHPIEPPHPWLPWSALALSLLFAGFDLFRGHLAAFMRRPVEIATEAPFRLLERLHAGAVGDHVAWMIAGLALLAAVSAF